MAEILGDSRARNVAFFHVECVSTVSLIFTNRWVAVCRFHGRIMFRIMVESSFLLATEFDGCFVQIMNLHFLRKSDRIPEFSDLGLLLLVCLAW